MDYLYVWLITSILILINTDMLFAFLITYCTCALTYCDKCTKTPRFLHTSLCLDDKIFLIFPTKMDSLPFPIYYAFATSFFTLALHWVTSTSQLNILTSIVMRKFNNCTLGPCTYPCSTTLTFMPTLLTLQKKYTYFPTPTFDVACYPFIHCICCA